MASQGSPSHHTTQSLMSTWSIHDEATNPVPGGPCKARAVMGGPSQHVKQSKLSKIRGGAKDPIPGGPCAARAEKGGLSLHARQSNNSRGGARDHTPGGPYKARAAKGGPLLHVMRGKM